MVIETLEAFNIIQAETFCFSFCEL